MMKFLIINNFISCILIYSLKSSLIPTFKLGLLASFLNINLFKYSKSLHKSKMCVISSSEAEVCQVLIKFSWSSCLPTLQNYTQLMRSSVPFIPPRYRETFPVTLVSQAVVDLDIKTVGTPPTHPPFNI